MEVGRVLLSSIFLLYFSLPLLFSITVTESQYTVSFSRCPRTFWDEFKSNLNKLNLDLLPVPVRAGGHFVPLLRKKFFKVRLAYSANYTASFNPVEITLVRSGDIHPQPGPEKQSSSRQKRQITLAYLNARSIKNRNPFTLIKLKCLISCVSVSLDWTATISY